MAMTSEPNFLEPGNEPVRYLRLAELIRADIENRALSPGDRLPSNNDLMRQYGASLATVTRALRVLQEAGLVETRRRSGVYLRERRDAQPELRAEKVVALLAPQFNDLFFGGILQGVDEVCGARGFRLIVARSNFDAATEREQIERLSEQVAGLMIVPVTGGGTYAAYGVLLERKLPFVFLDRGVEGLSAPLIATDNERGGYLVGRHLLETGCLPVAVFCELDSSSQRDRLAGFRRALREAGVAFDPSLVFRTTARNETAGFILAREWLAHSPAPRTGSRPGIFAMNDRVGRGAIVALREAGLSVPEDVALAGFDDVDALLAHPPLTTMHQNMPEMGRAAARILLDIICFGRSAAPDQVRIPAELIVRNSTDLSSDFSIATLLSERAASHV